MMIRHAILSALLLCVATPALAQTATPVVTDSRIKTFVYNESDVYQVLTHYGYQSNIEFGKGEQVNTVSVGDRVGWQIVPAGRRLFIKAMEENAHTNMTVITNKRAYQFDLRSSGQVPNYPSQELVYVVRFFYPEENPLGAQPPIYSDASSMGMPQQSAAYSPMPGMPPQGGFGGMMSPANPYAPMLPGNGISPNPKGMYGAPPVVNTAGAPPLPSYDSPAALSPMMPVAPPPPAMFAGVAGNNGGALPPLSNLMEDPNMVPGFPAAAAMTPMPAAPPPMAAAPAMPSSNLMASAAAAYAPVGSSNSPNYNYTFSGPEQSAPIKIYDDGKATYFTFQPGMKGKPKFFKVDSKGKETPVTATQNQSGEMVIPGLAPRFAIRHNGASITVYNESAISKQTM